MSRISQMVATGYGLSITAAEEASRFGVSEVDVEHILLALVIDEGTAGQVLRSMGLTLDGARTAVVDQHRAELARLGVQAELPGDGRIRFLERGGYEWNDRALMLLSAAGGKHRTGDSSAVLREVLAEPSGAVEDILERLGTTADDVIARLDEVAGMRERERDTDPRMGRSREVFVPAPVDDVWELVSDAERLPEWDSAFEPGSIEADGDGWAARSRTRRPDGTPTRVPPRAVRQRIRRVSAGEHRVEWRMSPPDAPRANSRSIVVSVEPAAGGTQVHVTFTWIRGAGPRGIGRIVAPVTRLLIRPLLGPLLWVQLTRLTGGISRALR